LQSYLTSADGRGTVLQAIALSPNGKRLTRPVRSLDGIAVFEVKESSKTDWTQYRCTNRYSDSSDFIPTEWYPTALAIAGNDLLIATAKGESSGPNNMQGVLKGERKRKEHPYIPTLIVARFSALARRHRKEPGRLYAQVEDDNLLRADVGKFTFAGGKQSHPPRDLCA